MKLDILVFAAHPDDAELGCGGTILKHIHAGKKVGIADLTQGEMGTRGSAEIRLTEAAEASKILGIQARENLKLQDCFFEINKNNLSEVARVIRKYQPEIVIANAVHDRHPDHGRAASLISRACFLAALRKFETYESNKLQQAWKIKILLHYIQDRYVKPHFVIDISDFMEKKMEVVKTFKSQFYNPDSDEPETFISSKNFFDFINARAMEFGRIIGVKYAEGFTAERIFGIENFDALK